MKEKGWKKRNLNGRVATALNEYKWIVNLISDNLNLRL